MHFFAKMHSFVFRTGDSYTAANKHHGTFSLVQRSYSCSNKFLLRHSDRQLTQLACMIFHHARLHVMCYIYKHRARTTAFGHLKSQAHGLCQFFRLIDQKILLGNRHSNTGNIYLLEGIMTDHAAFYLSGNSHYRNRIKKCICQTCYEIRRTGTGGSTAHANLAAGTCIAISSVRCSLFMRCQYMLNIFYITQRVVKRQYSTTGITKNCRNAFFLKAFHHNFSTSKLHSVILLSYASSA